MNKYVKEFRNLKCSNDILDIVRLHHKRYEKEITESMMIIKHLKKIILKKPNHYTLIDMCAGNALTSIIASYFLPIKNAIAIDIKPLNRQYDRVNNFNYIKQDIFDLHLDCITQYHCIIISSHPCRDLAVRITEIFKTNINCDYLLMIPCCRGNINNYNLSSFIKQKIGKYLTWCCYLASKVNGKIIEDKNCLSPCNALIKASK